MRKSSLVLPPACIQPSPMRAARRSAAGECPPIKMGIGRVGAGRIFTFGRS